MDFKKLPQDFQEEVTALKHGSLTIQEDVNQALEEATDLGDFVSSVNSKMEALYHEATEVANTFDKLLEDKEDSEDAKAAIDEVKKNGTVKWETIKQDPLQEDNNQKRELILQTIKWILGDMGYSPNMIIHEHTELSLIFGTSEIVPTEFVLKLEEKFSLGSLKITELSLIFGTVDYVSWAKIGDVIDTVMEKNSGAYKVGLKGETLKKILETLQEQGFEEAKSTEQHLERDLGMDSLDVVEFVMQLEENFDIELPDADVADWRHISDVFDTVLEKLP